MNDFWQRLKQRKLVQWAIAYVAFAFALVQVLDVVSGSYHWPDSAMHIVFGLLVLGFVVTVILAWYHGELDKPQWKGWPVFLAGVCGVPRQAPAAAPGGFLRMGGGRP